MARVISINTKLVLYSFGYVTGMYESAQRPRRVGGFAMCMLGPWKCPTPPKGPPTGPLVRRIVNEPSMREQDQAPLEAVRSRL